MIWKCCARDIKSSQPSNSTTQATTSYKDTKTASTTKRHRTLVIPGWFGTRATAERRGTSLTILRTVPVFPECRFRDKVGTAGSGWRSGDGRNRACLSGAPAKRDQRENINFVGREHSVLREFDKLGNSYAGTYPLASKWNMFVPGRGEPICADIRWQGACLGLKMETEPLSINRMLRGQFSVSYTNVMNPKHGHERWITVACDHSKISV